MQDSAINLQGSGRNRQDSDQLLHIHQRQEWSAAVFAYANKIRRTPPGVVAWVNPTQYFMAKTFLSRNLAFLLAARRPPHSTLGADVCEEVDQNLGGFCQNLGDSWQNIASENATAFAKNNVKKS